MECVPEKSAVLGIIDQGCSPVVDCAWLPHVPQPFTLAIHRDTNNSAVKAKYDARQLKQVQHILIQYTIHTDSLQSTIHSICALYSCTHQKHTMRHLEIYLHDIPNHRQDISNYCEKELYNKQKHYIEIYVNLYECQLLIFLVWFS